MKAFLVVLAVVVGLTLLVSVPPASAEGVRPCVYASADGRWVSGCSPLLFNAMFCVGFIDGDWPYTHVEVCVPTELPPP